MNMEKVVFSGASWVEEAGDNLFIPRLNNAYEQKLFESVLEQTGIEYWHVRRFAPSDSIPHMPAMERAFNEAVSACSLQRKIKKKNGSRVGLIYFDHYGPISFMERQAQIKEMYYSDVFPSFVLQNHNISGYSVRLRAERNAAMHAMKVAKDLIQADEMDVVFIGGINPCQSFFFLTEQLETHEWEVKQGTKPKYTSDKRYLVEAAGFVVLESEKNANQRGHEPLGELAEIESTREFYSRKQAAQNPLVQRLESLQEKYQPKHAWMGLFDCGLVERTERMLFSDVFTDCSVSHLIDTFGDAGSLNPIRVLHNEFYVERETDHSNDGLNKTEATLIHSTDRGGFGWNLIKK